MRKITLGEFARSPCQLAEEGWGKFMRAYNSTEGRPCEYRCTYYHGGSCRALWVICRAYQLRERDKRRYHDLCN